MEGEKVWKWAEDFFFFLFFLLVTFWNQWNLFGIYQNDGQFLLGKIIFHTGKTDFAPSEIYSSYVLAYMLQTG